jgi:hypothetical protein
MSVNPILHARTKHIAIDYHFVREKVALGTLITRFVPSSSQLADLFTKPLSRVTFDGLKSKLGLWATPTSSLKGGKEGISYMFVTTSGVCNSNHTVVKD